MDRCIRHPLPSSSARLSVRARFSSSRPSLRPNWSCPRLSMPTVMRPGQQRLRHPHLARPELHCSRPAARRLQVITRLLLALQGECESVTSWPGRATRPLTLASVGVCVRATRRRELKREMQLAFASRCRAAALASLRSLMASASVLLRWAQHTTSHEIPGWSSMSSIRTVIGVCLPYVARPQQGGRSPQQGGQSPHQGGLPYSLETT
jgi:hypothetical protein